MFETQYRTIGTGETIIWRKIIGPFGYTVEVLDNRKYEIEDKLNKRILEMQGLFEKLDIAYDQVLSAKDQIQRSSQTNPYHGDWKDIEIGKNSSKYRRKRAKPHNMWESVRNAVISARSFEIVRESAAAPTDYTSGLVAAIDQAVGSPAKNNQSKKEKRRQQEQHQ
jgi:hypothetical protein